MAPSEGTSHPQQEMTAEITEPGLLILQREEWGL